MPDRTRWFSDSPSSPSQAGQVPKPHGAFAVIQCQLAGFDPHESLFTLKKSQTPTKQTCAEAESFFEVKKHHVCSLGLIPSPRFPKRGFESTSGTTRLRPQSGEPPSPRSVCSWELVDLEAPSRPWVSGAVLGSRYPVLPDATGTQSRCCIMVPKNQLSRPFGQQQI